MKCIKSHIFCSQKLIDPRDEIQEIYQVIRQIPWLADKAIALSKSGEEVTGQYAYNRLFEIEFKKIGGWTPLHLLQSVSLKNKNEFAKNDVFVEVQFGNASSIYRDYHKFHHSLVNKLLSLSVLIVPTEPWRFFPSCDLQSITDMASYNNAINHFSTFTIPVPLLLIGLLPSNEC